LKEEKGGAINNYARKTETRVSGKLGQMAILKIAPDLLYI
jgi:hypothetical protein